MEGPGAVTVTIAPPPDLERSSASRPVIGRDPDRHSLCAAEEDPRRAPSPLPKLRTLRPGIRRGGKGYTAFALACLTGLLLSPLPFPTRAFAQEIQENVQHWCQDYWMLTRQEILDCLQRDYASADAELNRVYQERMAALTAAERTKLRTSQRAWLQRYDSVLTSYYSKPWANHSRVKVLPSQIKAVRDRTDYLTAVRVRE